MLHIDLIFLRILRPSLVQAAPAFGGTEEYFEIVRLNLRREAEPAVR